MKNVWEIFDGKKNIKKVLDEKCKMLVHYIMMVCLEEEEDGELLDNLIERIFPFERIFPLSSNILPFVSIKKHNGNLEQIPNVGINRYFFLRIELFIFYVHITDRFAYVTLRHLDREYFMDRIFHHASNYLIKIINIANGNNPNYKLDVDFWINHLFSSLNKRTEEYGKFDIVPSKNSLESVFNELCKNLLMSCSIDISKQNKKDIDEIRKEILKITSFTIDRFQYKNLFLGGSK